MNDDKQLLAELEDAVVSCMKCGNCMEVCPIYKELKTESSVARGKLALMEAIIKGDIEITDGIDSRMAMCVNCKACTAKCPCGVKADELIIRARAAIAKRRGLHPIKQVAFGLLKQRPIFDLAMRAAGAFGPIAFKRLSGRVATAQRFPIPGLARRRIMAPFAATPLRGQYPETITVENPKLKVAFFTGCAINYIYTDIGQSVINVLKTNNVQVTIPAMQHCCGTPVFISGDTELAKEFAKHNIETFEKCDVDYFVAACGSCTLAWTHEFPELLKDDPQWKVRAEKLASKMYEISQFLVDVLHFSQENLGEVNVTVTMHDPCHMSRGIKVTAQPRKVLSAIPGLKLIEMKDPSRCCGAGGSFCVAHYDIARQINERKITDIESTNAELVATSCGMCRMHINDGLVQKNLKQDTLHTVQILDRAYQAGRKK